MMGYYGFMNLTWVKESTCIRIEDKKPYALYNNALLSIKHECLRLSYASAGIVLDAVARSPDTSVRR